MQHPAKDCRQQSQGNIGRGRGFSGPQMTRQKKGLKEWTALIGKPEMY